MYLESFGFVDIVEHLVMAANMQAWLGDSIDYPVSNVGKPLLADRRTDLGEKMTLQARALMTERSRLDTGTLDGARTTPSGRATWMQGWRRSAEPHHLSAFDARHWIRRGGAFGSGNDGANCGIGLGYRGIPCLADDRRCTRGALMYGDPA